MRRLLPLVMLSLVVLAARADDKKDSKESQSPKDIFQELVKKFRAAKDADEKNQLFGTYGKKLLAAAKEAKDEAGAFEAIGFIYQIPDTGKDGPRAGAVELLKKNHVQSKRIGGLIDRIAGGGDPDESLIALIKAVMEKNEDKDVKAKACEALVKACENGLTMGYWIKHDSTFRKRVTPQMGEGKVKATIDGIPGFEKEMASALTKLRGEFKGQVKKDLYVGAKLPELTSKDLDDKDVKLSDLKGKVVVLDMWATWCPPCRAMIPHEQKMVEKFKGKPFTLVSVSFDDKKETVTKFLEDNKMPWTHWFNGRNGMIGKELGIGSFPTIFVLDAKGVIRYKGVRDGAMEWAVGNLLKEMEDDAKKAKTE